MCIHTYIHVCTYARNTRTYVIKCTACVGSHIHRMSPASKLSAMYITTCCSSYEHAYVDTCAQAYRNNDTINIRTLLELGRETGMRHWDVTPGRASARHRDATPGRDTGTRHRDLGPRVCLCACAPWVRLRMLARPGRARFLRFAFCISDAGVADA